MTLCHNWNWALGCFCFVLSDIFFVATGIVIRSSEEEQEEEEEEVTIFAYGQTGAGKTHTMYGTSENPGLAPRAIESLFRVIRREEGQGRKSFSVKAYMIELYKQDIIDLLVEARPKDQKSLQVKKDAGRGIMFVEGVSERPITSPEQLKDTAPTADELHDATHLLQGPTAEVLRVEPQVDQPRSDEKLLKCNKAQRFWPKESAGGMQLPQDAVAGNDNVEFRLSIIVEATVKDTEQVIYGKITLCDLAGSERPKKSEVSGEALKEAIEINKSLTALGDVIEALSKGSKTIPYRNHKLTMLMQDSLGGSAKTLMFVNCSPASSNSEESMMSLKWATRAKQVTNDVKRNADSKEVARLKQVIALMSQAQNAQDLRA
ncbi:KIN14E [Symbiodinium sp. KB8]|nr:KIN14E [Symbiodinium sp. KB8]